MTVQFSGSKNGKIFLFFQSIKNALTSYKGPLPSDLIKAVDERKQASAVYISGEKGAACPICHECKCCPVVKTISSKHGLRMHKCPKCESTFNSREEISRNSVVDRVKYKKGGNTKCPKCNGASKVIQTIDKKQGIRKHKCKNCQNYFESKK
jgi:formate dehydrogenase maturation protein FdhE